MKQETFRAHGAMAGATLLFGINYWVAKGLMPDHLLPMQIVVVRIIGTLLIAWLLFVFSKEKQKIDRSDLPRIFASGVLGVFLNQTLFFVGLNHTSPVEASLINSLNPLLVLLFTAMLLHERISKTRVAGMALGLTGALMLILGANPLTLKAGGTAGNLMILTNTVCWSLYLVISKPLMIKYSPLTLMRWTFLFGLLFVLPIGFRQTLQIDWAEFTSYTWLALLYIILGTTFGGYFFINTALKHISPPVVAYYTYVQPVIVAIMGITLFQGSLSWLKIISALLIFTGIYLITKKAPPKKAKTGAEKEAVTTR